VESWSGAHRCRAYFLSPAAFGHHLLVDVQVVGLHLVNSVVTQCIEASARNGNRPAPERNSIAYSDAAPKAIFIENILKKPS
jgi:hypothetical protein